MTIEIRQLSIKSSVADGGAERHGAGNDGNHGNDGGDPGTHRDAREEGEWRSALRRQWQELQELKQER